MPESLDDDSGSREDPRRLREENERLRSQAQRYELIHRVGRTLIEVPEIGDAMQRVVEMVASTLGYSRTAALLLDEQLEELELVSAYGYGEVSGLRIPLSQGATGYAARHNETVNIRDVTADPRYVKGTTRGRSELAVPIAIGDEVIGVVDVESPEVGAFGRQDVEVLSAVSSYAAAAVSSFQLREEAASRLDRLDDRTRRLDLLHRVSRSLTRELPFGEMLNEILRLCAEAFDLRHCAVLLADGEESLALRASIGYDRNAPSRLDSGQGITGHVAETGVSVLAPDVAADPRYISGVAGGRSEMAVPLRFGGRTIGVLDAESAVVAGFDEEDLDLFESFAAQAAIAIRASELSAREERVGSD